MYRVHVLYWKSRPFLNWFSNSGFFLFSVASPFSHDWSFSQNKKGSVWLGLTILTNLRNNRSFPFELWFFFDHIFVHGGRLFPCVTHPVLIFSCVCLHSKEILVSGAQWFIQMTCWKILSKRGPTLAKEGKTSQNWLLVCEYINQSTTVTPAIHIRMPQGLEHRGGYERGHEIRQWISKCPDTIVRYQSS